MINKVAVIGSGVMGAGIAAHIANAGFEVLLYDLDLKVAENAVSKLIDANILAHGSSANLIKPCGLDLNLAKLKDVDLVIEVIIEKLEVKQDLYKKILPYLADSALISSNTSTLLHSKLTENMPEGFAERFFITHFFNPPRNMELLELISSKNNTIPKMFQESYEECEWSSSGACPLHVSNADPEAGRSRNLKHFGYILNKFLSIDLGKTIIHCKDSPGFIANRIGCYFLLAGIINGINQQVDIASEDRLTQELGLPSTGIFGLADLIGIDLLTLIAKSFLENLNLEDDFHKIYHLPELLSKMIKDNYIGRKGKGGFYRMITDVVKIKQVINLSSGEYEVFNKYTPPEFDNLRDLLDSSPYLRDLFIQMFIYVSNLVGEIADNIEDIDNAMKLGFAWKYGPFELMDKIGLEYIAKNATAPLPDYFNQALQKGGFYQGQSCNKLFTISSLKKVIFENESALIKDANGVLVFAFKNKMNVFDFEIFDAFKKAHQLVKEHGEALVIASDLKIFSVGANLKLLISLKENEQEKFLAFGQRTMMDLKYADFPVVSALSGYALGGGCELALHSHSLAHLETYMGLVEFNVGLIPGWGGCKEMLYRAWQTEDVGKVVQAFSNIFHAKVSTSALYAKSMGLLSGKIVMNRNLLLENACAGARELVKNFVKKQSFRLSDLPIALIKEQLYSIQLTGHDQYIASKIIEEFFTGSNISEEELCENERRIINSLIKNPKTIERIEYMLKTGKKLSN